MTHDHVGLSCFLIAVLAVISPRFTAFLIAVYIGVMLLHGA